MINSLTLQKDGAESVYLKMEDNNDGRFKISVNSYSGIYADMDVLYLYTSSIYLKSKYNDSVGLSLYNGGQVIVGASGSSAEFTYRDNSDATSGSAIVYTAKNITTRFVSGYDLINYYTSI